MNNITPLRITADHESLPRLPGRTWLWANTREPWRAMMGPSRRRVAPLLAWAHFDKERWWGRRPEDVARSIVRLFEEWEIPSPLPIFPAGLSVRLARREMHRDGGRDPIPMPGLAQKYALYWGGALPLGGAFLIQPPPATKEHPYRAYVRVFDMNRAYAAALWSLPDITKGRWKRVREYAGPYGIYKTGGAQAMRQGWPGLYLEAHPELQRDVVFGWVPTHTAPAEWARRFVQMTEEDGREIARAMPRLFVGKMAQHDERSEPGKVLYTGYCYPYIWAWVTAWLRVRMEQAVEKWKPCHVFFDAMHVPCEPPKGRDNAPVLLDSEHSRRRLHYAPRAGGAIFLPRTITGSRGVDCRSDRRNSLGDGEKAIQAGPLPSAHVGGWKLAAEGWCTYTGLNQYRLQDVLTGKTIVKHQGVKAA